MLPVVLPLPLPCKGIDSSFHRSALGLLGFPLPGCLPAHGKAGTDFCFGSFQPLLLVRLAVARRYFFFATFFLAAFFLVAFFLATFFFAPAFFFAAGAFFLATFFFATAATFFFAAFFFAFAM